MCEWLERNIFECHFSEHPHGCIWRLTQTQRIIKSCLTWSSLRPHKRHVRECVCERTESHDRNWTGPLFSSPHFLCLYQGSFMFNILLDVASIYRINSTVILSCRWMWDQYTALYLATFLIRTIKAYEQRCDSVHFVQDHHMIIRSSFDHIMIQRTT